MTDSADIMGTDWVWYYSRNAIVINGKKYSVMEPVCELMRLLSDERDELAKKVREYEQ